MANSHVNVVPLRPLPYVFALNVAMAPYYVDGHQIVEWMRRMFPVQPPENRWYSVPADLLIVDMAVAYIHFYNFVEANMLFNDPDSDDNNDNDDESTDDTKGGGKGRGGKCRGGKGRCGRGGKGRGAAESTNKRNRA